MPRKFWVNCMATLKHISSKNSDYTAIEAYLVYQHDAFTGKQLLDEQGRPKLRESYLLDTLECGDFSFATACLLANRKYGKNTQHGDIKSHQYIISFDPRDAADNGLTMEKAQALGLKFCEENFPGHPAIVCTHPDGHNHSGNIHVHIVIGSIRIDAYMIVLFCEILRQYRSQSFSPKAKSQWKIVDILDFLEANYLTVTLQSTADHFGFHPNYLSAFIKKETGHTFKELVILQKMCQACFYLTNTDFPIYEIAQKVGYDNLGFFYRKFTELYHMTPQEFRERKAYA